MVASINLSLSNIVNVAVLSAPTGLGLPNINTAALFTSEDPSPAFSGDYKIYKTPSEVETDFGSGSEAFAQATAFFAQNPNPLVSGGYLVIIPLETAETVQAAIARTIDQIFYFGILVDTAIATGPLALLATYVQSIDKMLFYGSATAGDIETGGDLDLFRSGSKTHARGLYYTVSAAAARLYAAAYAGRALSTDFAGSMTTQTMHLKSLAGIAADPGISQTVLGKCKAAGIDCYPTIAGISSVFSAGENAFFDDVYNQLWLKFALQVAGYNHLRQTNTKVPQTEAGVEGLKNAYRAVCAQAVVNGMAAAGSWSSPDTFGNPVDLRRNITDVGYYIYSLPVAQQLDADRQDRKAPVVQIAVKSAGAIHSTDVIVNVNL